MVSRIEDYEGVEEVLREVTAKIKVRRGDEAVRLRAAYGRIASEDVLSPVDVPSRATSHMDGFAVVAEDLRAATKAAPVQLRMVGELGPGSKAIVKVGRGECARVATGAPLPEGADTVVPVEQAAVKGSRATVGFAPEKGSWVFGRGRDIRRKETIIRKGQKVRAQDVGLLLSLGVVRIHVYERPKVAVLATGSELTDGSPKSGQVRNSHGPIFRRLAEALGCQPIDAGIATDSPRAVSSKITTALAQSDFVMTIGGTSAGKHDVVGEVVAQLRPDVSFHGIRMDRGRVTGFAVVKGKPVLMMPGPILGSMTAFVLFGVPTIRLLSGATTALPMVFARMKTDWKARDRFAGFTKVVYVRFEGEKSDVAEPIVGDTESMSVLTKADGYVIVPEEVSRIQAGETVAVGLMPGFSFA